MRGVKGAVSVYLTLTLLLVVSLLLTAIESARTACIRGFVKQAAGLSMKSVLADYHNALFDRYHVFGRETGALSKAGKREFVRTSFAEVYEKNLPVGKTAFLNPKEVDVTITDCVSLTDYGGAFFRQQAVEFMEFREAVFAAESILSMLGLFDGTGKVAELLEEETAVQEGLSEIDRTILSLMQDIDGIKVDSDGIKQGWFGNVKIVSDFVKKLFAGTPDMHAVSIEVPQIYNAVKDKYEDPLVYLEQMRDGAQEYITLSAEKQANEERIAQIESEIAALSGQEGTGAKALELNATIVLIKGENLVLDGKLLLASSKYDSAEKKLRKLLESCEKAINSALSHIGEIRDRQDNATPAVLGYLETLSGAAEWLDNDTLQSLLENAGLFEEYIGTKPASTERIPDLDGMERTLKNNRDVVKRLLEDVLQTAGAENFDDAAYSKAQGVLCGYSYENLLFDYTGMKLKSDGLNPLETIKNLVKSGISSLVIPEGTEVSDRKYTGTDLPGNTVGLGTEKDPIANLATGITGLFQDSPLNALSKLIKNGASELAEDVLYLSYLFDHFGYYGAPAGENSKCAYELEYIVSGKLSDRENLNSVISKIVSIRTVMCFLHVVSSGEKRAEAAAFATAALGFTGMPVLVEMLKYTLMLTWAFEEALIEVSALLAGYRVPAVPTESSFKLTFPEVFLVNKTLIAQKAALFKGQAGLDYRTYLILLLLTENEEKQNLRTMDVVQENLRLSSDSFRMERLLYGFNLEALVSVNGLFPSATGKNSMEYKFTGGEKY